MTEKQFDTVIGYVLRGGVLLAFLVVGIGGALYLSQHYSEQESYSRFSGVDASLQSVARIWTSARHFQSEGLIQLGLLILIATPVLRVVMAVFGFALLRDRLYVLVSLIVLAIILYSATHALG